MSGCVGRSISAALSVISRPCFGFPLFFETVASSGSPLTEVVTGAVASAEGAKVNRRKSPLCASLNAAAHVHYVQYMSLGQHALHACMHAFKYAT